jgi:TusA-related sulfurtransferase
MSENLENLSPAKVVDARGSACPGPLLEAKKAIGTIPVGEVLEVISSDPSTNRDLPRWAKKVGHEFLGAIEGDVYTRLFIRRAK